MQTKLKLDLEKLALDSFATTRPAQEKNGTVVGYATACTFNATGCKATYHTCASFDVSC